MSPRAWSGALGALVAVRVLAPLAALAGADVPSAPQYEYKPLIGDATGFYAAARELISAAAGPAGAVAVLLLGLGGWAAFRLRPVWIAVTAAALAVSLAATALVLASENSGAAVIGWPLLWAVALAPFRVAGALDADVAFATGLALSLAANGVAVVATAYVGYRASGRRAIGLAAAALLVLWPFLTRPLAGPSAWENGSWLVDVGLALYTEPVSTALVTAALAVVLSARLDDARLAVAGALLGFATVVKSSNGLLAAVVVLFVVRRIGFRRALPLALAGAAWLPLVLAYWPKGYPTIDNVPGFSLEQATRSWGPDTLLFDPVTVAILLPLAVLGAFALERWTAGLLASVVVANALFYTFYEHTHLHPRFLYVGLPALFVLEAAGAGLAIRKGSESVRGAGL
jgi:hypothetical protein